MQDRETRNHENIQHLKQRGQETNLVVLNQILNMSTSSRAAHPNELARNSPVKIVRKIDELVSGGFGRFWSNRVGGWRYGGGGISAVWSELRALGLYCCGGTVLFVPHSCTQYPAAT